MLHGDTSPSTTTSPSKNKHQNPIHIPTIRKTLFIHKVLDEMGKEDLREQRIPDTLRDRNRFLHPEYPRIGWFSLPSSTSVTTQQLLNRKGKCERVSLLPWKRNKTQLAAKTHPCGTSPPRQRASHRQGMQRKQEPWPGHFRRVQQHQKAWEKKKMVWMILLRYHHAERV